MEDQEVSMILAAIDETLEELDSRSDDQLQAEFEKAKGGPVGYAVVGAAEAAEQ
jgi:hypothetical protein